MLIKTFQFSMSSGLSNHFSRASLIIRLFEFVMNVVAQLLKIYKMFLLKDLRTNSSTRYKSIIEWEKLPIFMQLSVTYSDTFKL
jgi:hypothetical protein